MPIPGFRDHCRVCGHVRCPRCRTVKPIRIRCALEDEHHDQNDEILGRTTIYTPEARAGLDKGTVVAEEYHTGSDTRSSASDIEYKDNFSSEHWENAGHAQRERETDNSSRLGVVGEMIADYEKGIWRPFRVLDALRKTGGAQGGGGEKSQLFS